MTLFDKSKSAKPICVSTKLKGHKRDNFSLMIRDSPINQIITYCTGLMRSDISFAKDSILSHCLIKSTKHSISNWMKSCMVRNSRKIGCMSSSWWSFTTSDQTNQRVLVCVSMKEEFLSQSRTTSVVSTKAVIAQLLLKRSIMAPKSLQSWSAASSSSYCQIK